MSKRARGVGKAIASQPLPFHYSEWVAEYDSRHEIHDLLAPWVVRIDSKAAVGLMLSCRAWRNAIKPEVLVFMKEFNAKFAVAQQASYDMQNAYPISKQSAVSWILADSANIESRGELEVEGNPRVAAKINEMQEALRVRRDVVADFHTLGSCFQGYTVSHALKVAHASAGQSEDPRQHSLHAAGPRSAERRMRPYKLGDATTHAYAAMAFKHCEICAPLGRKCKASGFTPAPYAQGVDDECMRLLYGSSECVSRECFCWNTIALEPLKLRSLRRGQLPYNPNNNRTVEAALRHMQIPVPIRCETLSGRLTTSDCALISKTGVHMPVMAMADDAQQQAITSSAHIEERVGRIFWLRSHPSLPHSYSFEHKLRLPPKAFASAEADMARAAKRDAAIKKATSDANREKLRGDIEALFASRSGLASQQLATIDALDAHFPGTAATARRILNTYNEGETEHALDVAFTSSFVNVADMMAVDLRRWDQQLAEGGRLATGRAYTWITGMSVGETPGIGLSDIANKLNDDPRTLSFSTHEWNAYVTTMHVFDALQWNGLTATKAQRQEASCSHDPLGGPEDVAGRCFWTIGIGVGQAELAVKGEVTYPSTRAEWINIYNAANQLLDDCDLESTLPTPPAQSIINEIFNNEDAARVALGWIEVMAQTLAYYPVTRAMGLDILTNYSTRGVIAAVGGSLVDLQMLDIAKTLKEADGEPME